MAEKYEKGTGTGRGGWRGGGRPVGSKKTNKTEIFYRKVSLEEKIYLEKCLDDFRQKQNL